MIAELLKKDVEAFVQEEREQNPLLAQARLGHLHPTTFGRYLANVRYVVSHTPALLKAAERRAKAEGASALAEYYRAKAAEEKGHDVWAENDLCQLRRTNKAPVDFAPTPAAVDLVRFLGDAIEESSVSYLAYVFLAEYVMVLLGPEWQEALEKNCAFPSSAMTVVSHHVELDREHVEVGAQEIESLTDLDDLDILRCTLRRSIRHTRALYRELADGVH